MAKGVLIAGLDVGTTKVCAIVGQMIEGSMNVLAVGSAPSNGLRKGIVVNIEATVESIQKAIEEVRNTSSVEINSVYVGVAGGHIKSFESYGAVGIKGSEVSRVDLDRALEAAKAVYVPLDREVLHVIPKEYVVDDQENIINPIGMTGVRLEARVQIVTGSVSAVQNLIRCCEKADLQVIDIVLEPLASSLATLKEEEMKQGVVMIDIGGGTTDIAFYKNGGLAYTSVVAIGGNHITNDIAIGLRLPVDEAERVKMAYGTVLPDNGTDEEIGIMVAGRERKSIPRSYLYEIINPRCEELLEIVRGELEKCGAYEEAIYGVVLTGGASQLKGLDRMAEAVLGLPVRIGFPENLSGLGDSVSDPKYSTGVGLLMYGAQNETQPVITGDMFGGILTRMKNWVKGFLGKQ